LWGKIAARVYTLYVIYQWLHVLDVCKMKDEWLEHIFILKCCGIRAAGQSILLAEVARLCLTWMEEQCW
jgi:hypothetical protein